MEDQGGAGGVPLHGHDDKERRRAPHVERRTEPTGQDEPAPVRAADTDEASRLDRPGPSPEPVREMRRGKSGG
ncbi:MULTISPECIES: hypothetical protein [unclassified Streptomyces]|uniref:hypothetical protein n=1 Tax=unclassified Streptomyces TaxID=2593676 RepID=UPI00224E416E|nr:MULTISPECIES: hypothetical protein [unclassified Streptomyces]MCX4524151.1 hypothetical protein [Streptomyces sp. NBC_01551]MCX4545330.1 hypothetical protein [Streptomyces sp. NBC_01565]